jgi:diguanylate cyclase (GGDEF)-like protein
LNLSSKSKDLEGIKELKSELKDLRARLAQSEENLSQLRDLAAREDAQRDINEAKTNKSMNDLATEVFARIQAEEKLKASEQHLLDAIESLQEGFALFDKDDKLVLYNEEYVRLHAFMGDFLKLGNSFEEMVRYNVKRGKILTAIDREEDFVKERVQLHRNPSGPIIRAWEHGTWYIINESKTPDGGIIQTFSDITDLKRAEEQISHMANHDALTGLPSLRLGKDRLTSAVAHAHRHDSKVALMFVDLDGFKEVNDTIGHDAGDEVLVGVAKRLTDCVRETDTVARIGGDEFTVVITEVSDKDAIANVAKKIIDSVSEPFILSDGAAQTTIGASVGIAIYPDHGKNAEALVRLADKAMYTVKRRGKNNYVFVDEIDPED